MFHARPLVCYRCCRRRRHHHNSHRQSTIINNHPTCANNDTTTSQLMRLGVFLCHHYVCVCVFVCFDWLQFQTLKHSHLIGGNIIGWTLDSVTQNNPHSIIIEWKVKYKKKYIDWNKCQSKKNGDDCLLIINHTT